MKYYKPKTHIYEVYTPEDVINFGHSKYPTLDTPDFDFFGVRVFYNTVTSSYSLKIPTETRFYSLDGHVLVVRRLRHSTNVLITTKEELERDYTQVDLDETGVCFTI